MDKIRVMVVDDDEKFQELMKAYLEPNDEYEVFALSDAKNILSHVHAFKPDVILLDLLMPTTGGIEVCEMLNKNSLGKTIPIIVISCLEKEVDKLQAYKQGVIDYLVKPASKEEVIKVIRKALQYK